MAPSPALIVCWAMCASLLGFYLLNNAKITSIQGNGEHEFNKGTGRVRVKEGKEERRRRRARKFDEVRNAVVAEKDRVISALRANMKTTDELLGRCVYPGD